MHSCDHYPNRLRRGGAARRPGFVAVALLVALLGSATAHGAPNTRWFTELRAPAQRGPADVVARGFLRREAARLGLQGIQLADAPRLQPLLGGYVVRFGQEYEGLPVFGAQVIVYVDGRGSVRAVVHQTARLDVVTEPVVTRGEARAEAAVFHGTPRLGRPSGTLGVLPTSEGGHLVWRVDGGHWLGRVRTYVDAVSGVVRGAGSRTRTALGTVWPDNPVTSPTPEDRTLPNLDAPEDRLVGRVGTVYRQVSGSLGGQQGFDFDSNVLEQLATSDGTGFFYQPSEPDDNDPFAEVNAYYHADIADTYFRDVHGVSFTKALSIVVNARDSGAPYDNAFSTPVDAARHAIVFGQGQIDFAYEGETVYHEFTHYMIDTVANIGSAGFFGRDEWGVDIGPLGLHEGLADYFAVTQSGDPNTGEYLETVLGPSRRADNTNVCPDDVVSESHFDGLIVVGAMWEIREALDASAADAIAFGAVALLPQVPSYQDFASGAMTTAAALRDQGRLTQTQVDTVQGILDARGMSVCGRALDFDVRSSYTTNEAGLDTFGQFFGSNCAGLRTNGFRAASYFQYRLRVPANAQRVTFRIQVAPAAGDLRYSAFVRVGSLVHYDFSFGGGGPVHAPDIFHHSYEDITDADYSITIDTTTTPAIQPGSNYYLAISAQNCPDTTVTVSAETGDLFPPDGGVADAGPADAAVDASDGPATAPRKGCNCRQGAGGSWPVPAVLLVLGLWLVCRRRRAA